MRTLLPLLLIGTFPLYGWAIERISLPPGSVPNDGQSFGSDISGDGRFVVFYSVSSKLVPGDTNDAADAFVYDRQSDTFERVSVDSDENETGGAGGFLSPRITPDGRFVLFGSHASDLVSGDMNGEQDLFVRDRELGITERVNVADNESELSGQIFSLGDISGDGRFVVFSTYAAPAGVDDTNGDADIYLRDRALGTTTLISVSIISSLPVAGNNSSGGTAPGPSISADGRYICFQSEASDLVFPDTNGQGDVFVYDRQESVMKIVAPVAYNPRMAQDGSRVIVQGSPEMPLPGETGTPAGVLSYPIDGGIPIRVGVDSAGDPINGEAEDASGRYSVFTALAPAHPGDTNGELDIYVHDMVTKKIARVSVGSDGAQALQDCEDASISDNGRWITFETESGGLAPPDNDGFRDILLAENPLILADERAARLAARAALNRKIQKLKKKAKKIKRKGRRTAAKRLLKKAKKLTQQLRRL